MREQINELDGLLETRFGTLYWCLNDEQQVSLQSSPKRIENEQGTTQMVANGVAHYLHAHLHLVDGAWGFKDRSDCYLRRADRILKDDPSDSARKKIKDEIVRAWNELADKNSNLFYQARCITVNNDIINLDAKIEQGQRMMDDLNDQRERLEFEAAHNPISLDLVS